MSHKILFFIAGATFIGGVGFWYFTYFQIGGGWQDRTAIRLDQASGDSRDRRCDITAYGAVPGPDHDATQAINQAISDCARRGGGTAVVPRGQWFTAAIRLASHVTLHLEDGAELIFDPNIQRYLPVVFTRFQGMELYNFSSLIYGFELEDVAITGPGKLIGNGDERAQWDGKGNFGAARQKLYEMAETGVPVAERVFGDRIPGLRPSFVQCVRCRGVLLDGFTVENGPFWTIHLIYSENVIARRLTIDTWSINTDGIVIDSTKNVLIEDSLFSTGDDAIAIKSGVDADGRRVNIPSENIEIRRIHATKGNGGTSIGSEMSGGVRNVVVRDSLFENTGSGFRMKANAGRGGFFRDILVENVEMNDIQSNALNIDFQYASALKSREKSVTLVDNVVIRDIRGSGVGEAMVNIDGLSSIDLRGLRLESLRFDQVELPVRIERANGVVLRDIDFSGTANTGYVIEESRNISVENGRCQDKGAKSCVRIIGTKTDNIALKGMRWTPGQLPVLFDPGVSQQAVTIE